MAEVPFLGCKISLISKCDIRYEGILYCVDPKESTISLSKVRSYGTESRITDPNAYVPPKNDIYDVIIFRASDVKDLRVDAPEPPGLSDPAIISARQSSSNSNFEGINNGSLPTSSGPSQQHQQQHQQHQQQSQQAQKPLLPFLPTGSNQKEQSGHDRPHPINYSSAVASAQRRARPEHQKEIGNNRKSETSSGRDGGGPRRGGDGGDRRDDRRNDKRDDRRDDRRRDDRRNDDRRPYERRDHDGGRRGDGRPPMRVSRGGYDRNHVGSRYNNNNAINSRRAPGHRDDRDSKGGPMNRRGGPPGGRRGRSGDRTGAPRGSRKSAPLKFDGEYDFDEANKLFLELEGKLKNMKIKEDGKENGEGSAEQDNSKSSNDQSEPGSAYDSDDQINRAGDSKDVGGSVSGEYYDKTKSFFDNISCEASERGQGKVNKPDWRKERQLNAETFGVSANYRRGGYRGRSYRPNGPSYRV